MREHIDTTPQLSCGAAGRASAPLHLQLLGCDAAAGAAGSSGRVSGCSTDDGGGPAARRNTGLLELGLHCPTWLSDNELAAAAAALPDLRQLKLAGGNNLDQLQGLSGAGLAAFTACRRLRDIELPYSADLKGQQLVAQLPRLASLNSVKLRNSPGVGSTSVDEVQAAFQAENSRHLLVQLTEPNT